MDIRFYSECIESHQWLLDGKGNMALYDLCFERRTSHGMEKSRLKGNVIVSR